MQRHYRALFIILLIAGFTTSTYGNEFIILRSKPYGLFSMFHYVLYYLQKYERSKIVGFKVDFAETGQYFDSNIGSNWWEYYFEPIVLGEQNNADQLTIIEENTFLDQDIVEFEFSTSIEENNKLINKYIKVKERILNKINNFQSSNFSNKYVIGVHYRGTDKVYLNYEADRISYIKVMEEISKKVSTLPKNMDYKIFVATDEFLFLHFMLYRFGEKICYYETKRSVNGIPLHLDKDRNPYQAGEDALIDALLLSRVDFLIRTSSNLSRCSRYFNPQLPVLELSKRKQEPVPCAEFIR